MATCRTACTPFAGPAPVTTVTGYLGEADLDGYILASDILVNLRFPSVGESSGTLARAFAAGNRIRLLERAELATMLAGLDINGKGTS